MKTSLPLIPYYRQSKAKERSISIPDQRRDCERWSKAEGEIAYEAWMADHPEGEEIARSQLIERLGWKPGDVQPTNEGEAQ